MYPTTELRWFAEGGIPGPVGSWFEQCQGEISGHLARTDFYLRVSDSDGLGIKIREGRLEIKQRTRQIGLIQLHQRVVGLVEQWRKWGFVLEPNQTLSDITGRSETGWIRVKKDRNLRRYQLASNGLLKPIGEVSVAPGAVGTEQVRGCDVELTSIQVARRRWWSLAFEAYGQVNSTHEDLLFMIDQLTELNELPPLEGSDSYGYPYLLNQL